MALFNVPKREYTSKFSKIKFLSFDFGQHLVRLIDEPKLSYVHFINSQNVTFKCLGDDCPLCKVNKRLIMENPDNFREQKGWNPRQERYYINVLDKTNAKICPNCSAEIKRGQNGQYPSSCPECSTFLTGVTESPLNVIKVANISRTNAELLDSFDDSTLNEQGEKIGIKNFDIMFNVIRVGGKKKTITPSPLAQNTQPIEFDKESLYDLSKAVLELKAEEVEDVLKGVSLKDIFAARAGETPTEALEYDASDVQEPKPNKNISEDLKKKIDELF